MVVVVVGGETESPSGLLMVVWQRVSDGRQTAEQKHERRRFEEGRKRSEKT